MLYNNLHKTLSRMDQNLMNKLKGGHFIGHDTRILLYKYSWVYKYSILLGGGGLVFDSPRLQEGIFVNICIYMYSACVWC